MSRKLAFPVPAGLIEGLDHALSERRKADPATPSRNAFLAQLVEDAVAAEIQNLRATAGRKRT